MLCEDERGKKYILKEIGADGGPWNVEEVHYLVTEYIHGRTWEIPRESGEGS